MCQILAIKKNIWLSSRLNEKIYNEKKQPKNKWRLALAKLGNFKIMLATLIRAIVTARTAIQLTYTYYNSIPLDMILLLWWIYYGEIENRSSQN